jgi:microcystin-dependent protein
MAVIINGTDGIDTPQINAGNIVGQVCFFAMNSAPAGFLACNGAAVSRSTYAALFAAIGTIYGVGNGTTTFNLPDLRGEFIRGLDNGRGVDSGRGVGSAQAGEIQSHTHGNNTFLSQTGAFTVQTTAGTAHTVGTAPAAGGTETRPRNVALLACIKF